MLVVGLAFELHSFQEGTHPIDGSNTPWNTFAIWQTNKLGLTGFLMASDGLVEKVEAGVEEVSAISLLQMLHPTSSKALLVLPLNGTRSWSTNW